MIIQGLTLTGIGVCTVYEQALSASQIQENYNAIKGRYGL